MAEDGGQIIIKRVKKGGHGHHGGAWKIAYADFVTAMMAFFLLLWLLNAVSDEQLEGISNYFSPTTVSTSQSGAGGMLGGQVIGEGASQSNSGSPSITLTLPPRAIGSGGEAFTDPFDAAMDEEDIEALRAQLEEQEFERAAEEIRKAVESDAGLADLGDSLLVDYTTEGMRIQLVDQDDLAMFGSASAKMEEYTQEILRKIAQIISRLDKRVAIIGHTDSTKFRPGSVYSNWELSADRALASRRYLVAEGVEEAKIHRVSGKADRELLLPDDPTNPRNRRITIVVLRDDGPRSESKLQGDGLSSPMPLGGPPAEQVDDGLPRVGPYGETGVREVLPDSGASLFRSSDSP